MAVHLSSPFLTLPHLSLPFLTLRDLSLLFFTFPYLSSRLSTPSLTFVGNSVASAAYGEVHVMLLTVTLELFKRLKNGLQSPIFGCAANQHVCGQHSGLHMLWRSALHAAHRGIGAVSLCPPHRQHAKLPSVPVPSVSAQSYTVILPCIAPVFFPVPHVALGLLLRSQYHMWHWAFFCCSCSELSVCAQRLGAQTLSQSQFSA